MQGELGHSARYRSVAVVGAEGRVYRDVGGIKFYAAIGNGKVNTFRS